MPSIITTPIRDTLIHLASLIEFDPALLTIRPHYVDLKQADALIGRLAARVAELEGEVEELRDEVKNLEVESGMKYWREELA